MDSTGIIASALCAVHCALLPVLLSISAFSGLAFLDNPLLERIFLCGSMALGISSLLPGYFRYHRKVTAIGILLFGFLCIALSVITHHVIAEVIFVTLGAMMIALAHFLNRKMCLTRNQLTLKER